MSSQRHNLRAFLQRFIDKPDECPLFEVLKALPAPHPEGQWIAGGAIRRTLAGQPIDSDIDYFFASVEQKDTFDSAIKASNGRVTRTQEHAITYTVQQEKRAVIVQAITMAYYANGEAVIDPFDFTITQFGYDGDDLVCGEFALWDLARQRLALHKVTHGVSTVRRLIKYARQGYTACGGAIATILEQVVADP